MNVLRLLSIGCVITGAFAVSEASARDGYGRGSGDFRGSSINRGFGQRPVFFGQHFRGRGIDRERFDRRRFAHRRFNNGFVFSNPYYYPYSQASYYPYYSAYAGNYSPSYAGYYGYNPSYYSGYGYGNYGYNNYAYNQPSYSYCIQPSVGAVEVAYARPYRTHRVARVARTKRPAAVASSNVLEVQRALKEKGFNPGPIDGAIGSKTREAIRSFQQKHGISPTGEINKPLLKSLGV